MKRNRPVRHRRPAPASPSVSLFPFLAVLLCTMGALILLLVVIARHARLQAAQQVETAARPEALSEEDLADLKASQELVLYRIEKLKESRLRAESELQEARLELGHIEDHSRRLKAQIEQLDAAWRHLEQIQPQAGGQRAALENELARTVAELADAEGRLAGARAKADHTKPSYAVVPYRGPNETFRRPIFLECRHDAIVIQPEGIEFRDADFEGPMGPGNPLAAALRAVREYLLSHDGFDPQQQGEPYPLLLVRPGGIGAYYAARMALKSWASSFGYELIEDDSDITYPAPDPELARVAREATDRARVLQEQLTAAAPRHYGARGDRTVEYRAAPTRGGVVADGRRRGGRASDIPDMYRPRYRASDGAGGSPSTDPLETEIENGSPSGGQAGNSPNRPGQTSGNETALAPLPSGSMAAALAPGSVQTAQPSSGKATDSPSVPTGRAPDGTGGGHAAGGDPTASGSKPGSPQSAAAGGGAQAGPSCPAHIHSLSEVRGRDWGLPEGASRSLPIARPVRVDCFADRLVIVPERGLGSAQTIALPERTADGVDPLVTGVWKQTDRWGIAGRGMYWRPVLKFRVAPGGDQRFEELRVLLDGSGLDVEKE